MRTGGRWGVKRFCLYAKHLAPIRKRPCALTQNLLALTQKQTVFFRGYHEDWPRQRQARKALKEVAAVSHGKTGVETIALKGQMPIAETLILLPLHGAATHHIKTQDAALGL